MEEKEIFKQAKKDWEELKKLYKERGITEYGVVCYKRRTTRICISTHGKWTHSSIQIDFRRRKKIKK